MRTIGRYRILSELGRGAMGVVYRALDPKIDREIAIKTIRLSDLADAAEQTKLRERLFREAQSAGRLSHPGIVTIYDVGEEGDIAYIAMECVEGPTLDRLIDSDPPDGKLVLSILSQTASALDYAHKRGIVHRDIKPANIMIHDRTTAKITDFGVAKIQSSQMTQAGLMVGTPNYMSPEQIQGQPVDGRSDQFSLAVIAFELLTGEKPFTADSIAALAYRIVREEPSPVHRLNPTIEWPVDTVIRRGLAKDPADRYPTCSDFVFALENACRACRAWRPLAGSAVQELATVTGPAAVREEPVSTPPEPEPVPVPFSIPTAFDKPAEPVRDPFPLRALRIFVMVAVGGGLVAALVVSILRYAEQRQEAAVQPAPSPQQSESEPASPRVPKPSAMPELPGETPPGEQPATAATTKAVGNVNARFVTNPAGAFLVLDGVSDLSCQSPCTLPLAPGRHTLAATLGGYRRTLRILHMPEDSEVFLDLERSTGTLMVRSEPNGASVLVDGQTQPQKTPATLTIPAGTHQLEVVLNGQSEQKEITIKDSAITNVAVSFDVK
jgi:serine/threonine-protein kinase